MAYCGRLAIMYVLCWRKNDIMPMSLGNIKSTVKLGPDQSREETNKQKNPTEMLVDGTA